MEAFKQARIAESVELFDGAARDGYPTALLWQRGLSLYYAERYTEGSAQFRKDVEANPSDTEESIWAMLCEAREGGFAAARRQMLEVGRDPRPVMRTAYDLFRGVDDQASAAALERSAQEGGHDGFYAALYLGLFAEARGAEEEAQRWISQAAGSEYALASGDYMSDLARVHAKLRGWSVAHTRSEN